MIISPDFRQYAYHLITMMRLRSSEALFMIDYIHQIERNITNDKELEYYLPKLFYSVLSLSFNDKVNQPISDLDRERFFNIFYFHSGLTLL